MQILEKPPAGSNQIDCLIMGIIPASNMVAESKLSGWQQVLEQLETWQENPDLLEDDGIDPPLGSVLSSAKKVAKGFKSRGIDAPIIVIPNGDGGLVFRWKSGDAQWTVEFEDDGFIESYLVVDDQVQCRHGLQAA